MKHLYLICIATFLSLTSLRAQTLEGGFTILGEETVTPTEVQVTAVGGQPFVGTTEVDQFGYGLVETISTANEQSQSNEDGLLTLMLDRTSLSLYEGDNAQLTASYSMEVSNPLLRWSSSDAAVATVANGQVRALSSGNAIITVVSANGVYSAECAVSVQAASTPDPFPIPDPDPSPTPDPDPEDPTAVEQVMTEQVYCANGILYVELLQAQRFQVISAAGKLLHDVEGLAGQNRLPMQAYSAGIYFVRLEDQVVGVVKR